MGSSLLQEEIRWLINPELFIQRLLFEELEPNEAAVVHGAEKHW